MCDCVVSIQKSLLRLTSNFTSLLQQKQQEEEGLYYMRLSDQVSHRFKAHFPLISMKELGKQKKNAFHGGALVNEGEGRFSAH